MPQSFDRMLAFHCAPALAGIKPACLVCCAHKDYPELTELIALHNAALNSDDIYFDTLYNNEAYALLLVYRRRTLSCHLLQEEQCAFLGQAGYPQSSLDDCLIVLKQRLQRHAGEFPHEIGVFLGYPPQDIAAFCRHRGQHYLIDGYWKVYQNVQEAHAIFCRYDRCRNSLCRHIDRGLSIRQLFSIA